MDEKIYTIVKKVVHVIEVRAIDRKAAHELCNAQAGKCIDTKVGAQYIAAVRSVSDAGTGVVDQGAV